MTLKRLGALLLAAALLVACGSDDDDSAASGANTPASGGSTGADDSTAADFNDADVAFAQGMIPHHRQAVEMAVLADDRAASEEVKDLATRIEAAQDPEIETMKGWLEDWGKDDEPDSDGMAGMDGGGMSGMMSEDDMTMLEELEGVEFDQQFLEMMAEHHRGAIEMAQTEIEDGRFSDAIALAEEIVESQMAEVQEIEELLAT